MESIKKILMWLGVGLAVAIIVFAVIQMMRANSLDKKLSAMKTEADSVANVQQTALKLVVFYSDHIDSIFNDGRIITHRKPPEAITKLKPARVDTVWDVKDITKYYIFRNGKWEEANEKMAMKWKGDPAKVKKEIVRDSIPVLKYTPDRLYSGKSGFCAIPQLYGGVLAEQPIEIDFGARMEWVFWQPFEGVVLNAGTAVTRAGITPLDAAIRMPIFSNLHLTVGTTKRYKDIIKIKQGWVAKAGFAVDLR